MKEQKKNKEQLIKEKFGVELTLSDDLNKYSRPEYEPAKLKKVEAKFVKHTAYAHK